jgi:NADH:ubiquinone oxidoreductase subunit
MQRVLQLFRRGPALVGRDLAGNKYFESPPVEPGGRPKRMMKTGQSEMDTAMDAQIPVQWLGASPTGLGSLQID